MRLVLLNGLPGSGKSTLAARYAAVHPGAAVVDVDAVRAGLDHPDPLSDDAGLAAREMALQLARDHLLRGDDVLVPQLLARPPFLEALERLAAQLGARFVEVLLVADPDDVARRLTERAARAERPEHRLTTDLLAQGDPLAVVGRQLDDLVRSRPGTLVVRSVDGEPAAAVTALHHLLDGGPPDDAAVDVPVRG